LNKLKKMQHLEFSGAVRPLKWSLGVRWLTVLLYLVLIVNTSFYSHKYCYNYKRLRESNPRPSTVSQPTAPPRVPTITDNQIINVMKCPSLSYKFPFYHLYCL